MILPPATEIGCSIRNMRLGCFCIMITNQIRGGLCTEHRVRLSFSFWLMRSLRNLKFSSWRKHPETSELTNE